MTHADRGRLTEVRQALLHLHKTLLDWERAAYERLHGRVGGHQLLHAILNDPQFAWLRPVSELIVRIDEMLEQEAPDQPGEVEAMLDEARALVTAEEAAGPYGQRYREALQDHPDAVFAHRDLMHLLRKGRDISPPPPRLH